MKKSYETNGSIVTVDKKSDALVYTILHKDNTLQMSFSRAQSLEKEEYYRSMGGMGGDTATKGKYMVSYNIGVDIDGESQNFKLSPFNAHSFDEWGTKVPEYNIDLGKGIPPYEHKEISAQLKDKNSTLAEIFDTYVFDSDKLSKANNLLQSAFHEKLNGFLRQKS